MGHKISMDTLPVSNSMLLFLGIGKYFRAELGRNRLAISLKAFVARTIELILGNSKDFDFELIDSWEM